MKMQKKHFRSIVRGISGFFVATSIVIASTSIETSLDSAIQYIQKIIFTDDGGNSGTTGVIIDGTDGSINTNTITLQNGATVSNIKAEGDMGITNNNSLATTEAISGFVNTKLAGFSTENFYLNDGSFNSSNGELTLVVDGTGNQVIDLDGRYLESFTEDDPEVGTLTSGKRCIENGGVIDCTEDEPVLNETDPVFMANSGDFVNKSDNQTIYGDKTFKDTFVVDDDATIEQDLTVNGNFYVNGTETVINSTNVQIDDKKVILGEGGDDILVNGAGIATSGTDEASILRNNNGSDDYRESSEDFNLAAGKKYMIDGNPILNMSTNSIPYYDGTKLSNSIMFRNTTNNTIVFAGPAETSVGGSNNIGDMDEVEGLFYEGNSNEDRIIATAYPFGYSFAGDNIRVLSNGRVGIGNTAPGYDLSIGGAGSEKTIQIGDPSNGIFIDNGDYRPKVYGKKSNSAAWMIGISDDIDGIGNNVGFKSRGDRPLTFLAGDSERVRITTGGNVGIGTDTPNAKLEIEGTYNTDHFLVRDGADNDTLVSVKGEAILSTQEITLGYIGDNHLTITDGESYFGNGEVGIGRTTPAATLDLINNISLGADTSSRDVPDEGIELRGSASSAILGVQDGNGRIQLKRNASDGTNETYLMSGEDAFFRDLGITSDPVREMKYAGDGTAGNTILRNTLLSLGQNGDLTINGDAYADDYYYNSDIRYKENLETLTNPMEKLLQLNGYSFDWKESGERSLGLIAQEVEQIYPELVTTKEDGYKAVKYANFVAPLIEAVKQIYNKILNQEKTIQEQEQRINQLESEITEIKKLLQNR